MPIQLNQLNPQALAALAGNNPPRMELPVASDSYIKGMLARQSLFDSQNQLAIAQQQQAQQQQSAQWNMYMDLFKEQGLNDRDAADNASKLMQEQYKQQQANARSLLTEQGAMQRANMQNQLGYAQLGDVSAYRQGQLGLGKAQLQEKTAFDSADLQTKLQSIQMEKYKADLSARMEMGKQTLQQRSALAAAYANVRKGITDPQKQAVLDSEYLQLLKKSGLADDNYIQTFNSAPPEMKSVLANGDIALNKNAVTYLNNAQGNTAIQKAIAAADQANAEAGLPPMTEKQKAQLLTQYALNGPNQNRVQTPIERASGEAMADRMKQNNTDIKTYRSNQLTSSLLEDLSDSTDSGKLAQVSTNVNNWANSVLGLPIDPKTPLNETFNAIARQFQVNVQSLMKGQTSDRDMVLMQELGPQLTNTAPGRKLMAQVIKYTSNAQIQRIAFETEFMNKNGTMAGMEESWDKFLQTRQDISKDGGKIQFNTYNAKDWKPFVDPNYEPAKQEEKQSQISTQSPTILTFNPDTGKLE